MQPNKNSPTNEVEPKSSALPQDKGEDKLHAALSLEMDSIPAALVEMVLNEIGILEQEVSSKNVSSHFYL
ncbi:hypothetical protein D8674_034060 [Pyrus ussuriensis x Pyrus communis]|uniref:Uncharacterized protein n=1 Tax=Pyrus ussuriensis x Pyrus communis TaxID=2448454 RepID=A0A5N5HN44_9ROSA|nr:hypothetical protein D8674_034060 [Pyrus ussuriensis x Pyrus communis]